MMVGTKANEEGGYFGNLTSCKCMLTTIIHSASPFFLAGMCSLTCTKYKSWQYVFQGVSHIFTIITVAPQASSFDFWCYHQKSSKKVLHYCSSYKTWPPHTHTHNFVLHCCWSPACDNSWVHKSLAYLGFVPTVGALWFSPNFRSSACLLETPSLGVHTVQKLSIFIQVSLITSHFTV